MSTLPLLVTGAFAVAAIGAVVLDHDLNRRSAEYLDTSVYRGPADRRSVALTFNGGPGPQTLDLLAYLAKEQVHATFFQRGVCVERHPEITRRLHTAGHEIANHGYSDRRLTPRLLPSIRIPSPRLMYRELARTQRLLTNICGVPPQLFRAPYGKRWIGLDAVRQRLGLIGVQCTIQVPRGEQQAEQIARHVLSRVVPGAIVCFEDGGSAADIDLSNTLAALRLIIPALRDKGYSFRTVSELLSPVPGLVPVAVS